MSDRQQAIARRRYQASRKLRYVEFTYTRGSDAVPLRGIIGSTFTTQVYDEVGSQVRGTVRDYLILPEELVIAGDEVKPQAGDRITEEDGTSYEVVPIGDQSAWRWSDPHKTILRVHTHQIGGV